MDEVRKVIVPEFHDVKSRPARYAGATDRRFFRDRPAAVWRVRPLLDGESPAMSAAIASHGGRAYAIVIDHRRAKDKRRRCGRVVYPVWAPPEVPKEAARDLARREAERLVARFARTFDMAGADSLSDPDNSWGCSA